MSDTRHLPAKSHMPDNTFMFEKFVPAALIVMGIVTAGLILFAAGILLGIVQY